MIEKLLSNTSAEIRALFEEFDNRVLGLSSDVVHYPTLQTISYKTSLKFVELRVQKNQLRILLRTIDKQIDDPKKLTQVVPESHGWGNLSHILYFPSKEPRNKSSLDDVMALVTQSFKATQ
ncbi:DUF5655 domain-containing protein [Chitinophagaceae bacterium MMS25-I14]